MSSDEAPRVHDLASLLHPYSVDAFLSAYWEREPLFIRRADAEYYRALLTSRDIEEVISNPDARYPSIQLAKGGWYYPPDAYTKDEKIGQSTFQGLDLDKVAAEYGKGATIAISALHRTWEPLRALCVRLEEELDHSTNTNVYVTPGRAVGFPAHYDTHEVLVLQIAGRKRWRIDAPTIRLPHPSQEFKREGFVPGPFINEIELQPGDLLYLPRGYGHSTTTSESHSVHITIGVQVYTWADLVGELVPSRFESEELRKGLPAGFASRTELRPALKQHFARVVPSLPTDLDLDEMFDRLARMTQAGRRRRPARFRADAVVISADTVLQTPAQPCYHVAQGAEQVTLEFDDRTYRFPPSAATILGAMCVRRTFRVGDLSDSQISGFPTEAVLGFARYLQSIGFLRSAP